MKLPTATAATLDKFKSARYARLHTAKLGVNRYAIEHNRALRKAVQSLRRLRFVVCRFAPFGFV
jgi:hypothetical protein